MQAQANWRIILDDDGSGEVADVIAIAATDRRLEVLLVHCKFAITGKAAARIDDLYAVCGQAQKSARWGQSFTLMLEHLVRRERRRAAGGRTGFVKGNLTVLQDLADRARTLAPTFSIVIAQPGISKKRITQPQLHLLASTEVYLNETHLAEFYALASA